MDFLSIIIRHEKIALQLINQSKKSFVIQLIVSIKTFPRTLTIFPSRIRWINKKDSLPIRDIISYNRHAIPL